MISIGMAVIVKKTNVKGKVIATEKGQWVVQFPNGSISHYPTAQLKPV